VPNTEQRLAHDQRRRPDLGVAAAGVQVEHEVHQRAGQLRGGTAQHGEAGARDLGAGGKVEDAELLADLPVRPGHEVEARRLAPGGLDPVGRFVAVRHRRVRRVRDQRQGVLDRLLGRLQLGLQALDGGRQLLHAFARRGELRRLLVQAGHLLVGGVAVGAQLIHLLLDLAAGVGRAAVAIQQVLHGGAATEHLFDSIGVDHDNDPGYLEAARYLALTSTASRGSDPA
jgi:hypothetical protein